MPRKLSNDWTLKKLIQNTYAHQYSKTRFDYKIRDFVKVVRITKITAYDGQTMGHRGTKFVIETRSTPQYYPYYTIKDSWGRKRLRQTKYTHQYDVVIRLDSLSIDVPFKGRVGSIGKWDFSDRGKSRRIKGRVYEGANIQKGRNGDFFFRCEYVWHEAGILYGRCYANQPPTKVNPYGIVFAPKHFLAVVEFLMNGGILK